MGRAGADRPAEIIWYDRMTSSPGLAILPVALDVVAPSRPPDPMPDFRSELSEAAQTGDLATVRRLLDRAPDFANMPDQGGYTPLHYAAYFGHAELAEYLVGIGADPLSLSMDPLHNTPLHAAATGGHAAVVQVLLDAGADPNALQTGGWTPLHSAADRGHAAVAGQLLAAGADAAALSVSGKRASELAREKGHQAVIDALEAGR